MADETDDLETPAIGHNSGDTVTQTQDTIAAGQLRSYIERIERLEEEKKTLADDIREVKAEAKGNGFDSKIITRIVRIRKMDKAQREEEEHLTELYLHALGMI